MKDGWIFFLALALSTGCGAEPATSGSKHAACTEKQPRPVLFIHGSELDSTTWYPMLVAFKDAGYADDSLVLIDLQPNNGDNVSAAQDQISAAVEELRVEWQERESTASCGAAPQFKIDLVTHSMGAFSGRWYATRVAPHRVHTFVSIAGANHGTNALCGSRGEGNRQMCPAFAENKSQSQAQVRLNGTSAKPADETPYGEGADSSNVDQVHPDENRRIRYFTVRIEPDEWITPASSALLDGADRAPSSVLQERGLHESPTGNFLLTASESHDNLPRNETVIRLVLELVSATQASIVD